MKPIEQFALERMKTPSELTPDERLQYIKWYAERYPKQEKKEETK